jgi:hypothetical protein
MSDTAAVRQDHDNEEDAAPPDAADRPATGLRARGETTESDLRLGGFPKFGIISYAVSMLDVALIRERFEALSPHLDERGRRLFAATEAAAAGYGGIAAVSRITGIAASTIGAA